MARLDELAEGISKVLTVTATPEPLPLDLVGEGPVETTVLVRAIVDSCRRRGLDLYRISLDPDLGTRLLDEHSGEYEGVRLETDGRLRNRIEIWREPAP